MGDVRPGASGSPAAAPTGKRVARHSSEQPLSSPYAGRRVARPVPPEPAAETAVPAAPTSATIPVAPAPYVGRRIARVTPEPEPAPVLEPVVTPAVLVAPEPLVVSPQAAQAPVVAPVVHQPALPEPQVPEPTLVLEPLLPPPPSAAEPAELIEPLEPVLDGSPEPAADVVTESAPEPPGAVVVGEPVVAVPVRPLQVEPYAGRRVAQKQRRRPAAPSVPLSDPGTPAPSARRVAPKETPARPSGRRAANRSRLRHLPGAPVLMGLAILAVSAGGALQAMNPSLGGNDAGHLTAASALSGTSAVGSASLLGGRGAVVSRSADRTASGLQAQADAQLKARAAALSALGAQAQKQAQKIRLHSWVLPVKPGTYQLTARFGQYSALWSHFHTGLDFAAPTGTPIMAVAGGTITEMGWAGAFGNRTIETLPDGTELWYCHQNAFGTSVGAAVRPGEVIGYIGSTGNVTGPHLHLEVHPGGGDAVDPYAALVAHGLYPGPPN